jgi:hypothetical protein
LSQASFASLEKNGTIWEVPNSFLSYDTGHELRYGLTLSDGEIYYFDKMRSLSVDEVDSSVITVTIDFISGKSTVEQIKRGFLMGIANRAKLDISLDQVDKVDFQAQSSPHTDIQMISIETNDNEKITAPLESLEYGNNVSFDFWDWLEGVYLVDGSYIPFKKMRSMELMSSDGLKVNIVLLNSETVSGEIKASRPSLRGTTIFGPMLISLYSIKSITFQ